MRETLERTPFFVDIISIHTLVRKGIYVYILLCSDLAACTKKNYFSY